MKLSYITIFAIAGTIFASCNSATQSTAVTDNLQTVKLSADSFKRTTDGKETSLYILKNSKHAEAVFTNYGGRLVSLLIPDKEGKLTDVVVGFNSVYAYEKSTEPYFGATIGRYGNRIAKGKFSVDGHEYALYLNNGQNTLHGGKKRISVCSLGCKTTKCSYAGTPVCI
ncbi:aldose epimerase family protein [Pedobacter sp. NJ-S-72]